MAWRWRSWWRARSSAGCVIACLGMIYAFYVKPLIKRRNERLVLEEIARAKAEGRKPSFPRHTSESVHA